MKNKKTSTHHLLEILAKCGAEKEWQEAMKRIKTVDIDLISDIKEINTARIKAKVGNCYHNALAVCIENRNVQYVEGYLEVHGIPLDHAWNCYKGLHFDITQEVLEKKEGKPLDCPHRLIMTLSSSEVLKYALESGISGPYLMKFLRKHVNAKKKIES